MWTPHLHPTMSDCQTPTEGFGSRGHRPLRVSPDAELSPYVRQPWGPGAAETDLAYASRACLHLASGSSMVVIALFCPRGPRRTLHSPASHAARRIGVAILVALPTVLFGLCNIVGISESKTVHPGEEVRE